MAKRNNEQNALFHCFCREITKHVVSRGAKVSEKMIKQAVLSKLGNVVDDVIGERIYMASSDFAKTEHELTPTELKLGFISMDQLIIKMQVWASTDLGLELKSPNEEAA